MAVVVADAPHPGTHKIHSESRQRSNVGKCNTFFFFTFMHMTKIILNKALCGWRAPQQALNAVIVCLLNVWADHTCTHSASHTNAAENAALLQGRSLFEYSDASNADLVACSQSIFELIHMSWWLLSKTPWSSLYFLLIFTTFPPVFSLFCPFILPSTLPLWLAFLFFFFFTRSLCAQGAAQSAVPVPSQEGIEG